MYCVSVYVYCTWSCIQRYDSIVYHLNCVIVLYFLLEKNKVCIKEIDYLLYAFVPIICLKGPCKCLRVNFSNLNSLNIFLTNIHIGLYSHTLNNCLLSDRTVDIFNRTLLEQRVDKELLGCPCSTHSHSSLLLSCHVHMPTCMHAFSFTQ